MLAMALPLVGQEEMAPLLVLLVEQGWQLLETPPRRMEPPQETPHRVVERRPLVWVVERETEILQQVDQLGPQGWPQ